MGLVCARSGSRFSTERITTKYCFTIQITITASTNIMPLAFRALFKELNLDIAWPRSFSAFFWTETETRSIKTQKKNKANISQSS